MSAQGNAFISRRRALAGLSASSVITALAPTCWLRGENHTAAWGLVIGEEAGAAAGQRVLQEGGNAVDAVVAAALAAAVASPHNCGLGGYGGHLLIALAGRRIVQAIDFNTAAPAAAHEEMFHANHLPSKRAHERGWYSVGVPGVPAGLQLALERFGSKPLPELLQPALRLATEGFRVSRGLVAATRGVLQDLRADDGSSRLFLENGEPPVPGERMKNLPLAGLLETFQKENSVRSFYQGEIAAQMARASARGGGWLQPEDLAAYQANLRAPLRLDWEPYQIWTPPLTSGGLTVLQALKIFQALPPSHRAGEKNLFAQVEALRCAWRDRLEFFGDPSGNEERFAQFLSDPSINSAAEAIREASQEFSPLPGATSKRHDRGTVHLSSIDRWGNMAALTFTQGNAFGSCVSVPELGLVMGHGLSRFEREPGHPNSPGPGKRPLHNMCPTIVTLDGQPVMALGGAGGRLIPSSVYCVLLRFLEQAAPFPECVRLPRLHTEGDLEIRIQEEWPIQQRERLEQWDYRLRLAGGARVSAVFRNPQSGAFMQYSQ